MDPLISILIPAYNAAPWVADAIQSATAQTWKRKEIIVVDDGSADQTLAIAQRFGSKIVRVVTQSNQGASSARNKALSLSQGDYIQWLDADDLMAPDKIEKQLTALKGWPNKRTLLSSAWAYFYYRPGRARFTPTPLWSNLSPLDWVLCQMQEGFCMANSTWLVSRELTEAAGPWDVRLSYNDDGEYFCRVILASDGICFIPEARTYYRILGRENLSVLGRSKNKLESLFVSMELYIDHVRSVADTAQMRLACVRYLQNALVSFYPEWPNLVWQAEQLAASLGDKLEMPQLPWKYAWIQRVFGWTVAKRVQMQYNTSKSSGLRCWDNALFRLGM